MNVHAKLNIFNIGFDFDGVCADTPQLKSEIALQKFGISIPIEDIKRSDCLKRGLTEAQYNELQSIVYSSFSLKPINECEIYLNKIIYEGHFAKIISLRKKSGEKIIESFIEHYNLNINEYFCTDNHPKSGFCKGLDIFLDDSLENLIELRNIVKHLYLFNRPYNQKENLPEYIKRVEDWEDFYERIMKLSSL